MIYVTVTKAPDFEAAGLVHRLAGHDETWKTRCGLALENTETTATLVLRERPRKLPLCKSCKK